MRLHSNHNLAGAIARAAKIAGAEVFDVIHNDSRSHEHGFTVKLTGDAPNRPMHWDRDRDGDVRAASWDQWGVFLSVLFDVDRDMVVGSVSNPTYANVYDFDRKTSGRFARHVNADGVRLDPATMEHLTMPLGTYVPTDMHNRHTFDHAGELATGGGIFRCRKCTAAKVVTR